MIPSTSLRASIITSDAAHRHSPRKSQFRRVERENRGCRNQVRLVHPDRHRFCHRRALHLHLENRTYSWQQRASKQNTLLRAVLFCLGRKLFRKKRWLLLTQLSKGIVKGKSRLNQGCKLFYAFRSAFFQVRDSVPLPDFSVVLCKPQSSVGTD